MATDIAMNPSQTPPDNFPKSDIPWPDAPDPLKDYYHDCHIYGQNGQALFVSAALTGCSMDPEHSHEAILPNTCPHKVSLLYLEFTLAAWNSPTFDEKTGCYSYLSWNSGLDIKPLTHPNFKSLAKHTIVSSPGRVFTASPSVIFGIRPAFDNHLIYPEGLDRSVPVFRPTVRDIATHLFIKIPWRPNKPSPERIEVARRAPLSDFYYWCAINDYYRIGVDYWLVPIAEKPPTP